jgi:hypothetical protein
MSFPYWTCNVWGKPEFSKHVRQYSALNIGEIFCSFLERCRPK